MGGFVTIEWPEDMSQYPEHFRNFIETCMQVDPKDRPSAQELMDHPFLQISDDNTNPVAHVVKVLDPELKRAAIPSKPSTTYQLLKRHWILIIVNLTMLALLCVAGVLLALPATPKTSEVVNANIKQSEKAVSPGVEPSPPPDVTDDGSTTQTMCYCILRKCSSLTAHDIVMGIIVVVGITVFIVALSSTHDFPE